METRVKEGRTALAITLLLIATLTVPTVVMSGGLGLAQSQQSPSPTGTAPAIQLVNPSDYNENQRPVISDKDNDFSNDGQGDDPDDDKYHFNAWTRNTPNNATVEFFIIQGANQLSLGPATNRGGGVFDLYSAIPDALTEGDAVVRAILFSGTTEVARDDQDVDVNQDDDESPAEGAIMQGEFGPGRAAETVEMTYPQNTGGAGFFGRPGQ
ncbi:MAG TPA: hypothetical protein VHN37_01775, partial [Actinomycetota bacterium]|nr:hypothetical protein [Actinomycetota bacterium]